jgi:hypothetical protein
VAADRQMRHHDLDWAAGGEIAIAIGKADHGIGVADIDPLRIGSGRIERDAERVVQARCERARRRRAVAVRPQHADAPGAALRDENVAIRRHANDARLGESRGK